MSSRGASTLSSWDMVTTGSSKTSQISKRNVWYEEQRFGKYEVWSCGIVE